MKRTQIGIIGGGQLGLLLTQAAMRFPVQVSVYDPNKNCPAAFYTECFTKGEFEDYQGILNFGQKNDVLIFETEKVNIQALLELEKRGKRIVSSPGTLAWIQDKGVQKETLIKAGLPVTQFTYQSKEEIKNYAGPFPIVQKWRTGGYDGYGVQIHKNKKSILTALEKDSIFEEKVDIKKEVSIIIARGVQDDIEIYPPTEMVFDPQANLVDYLISPARLKNETLKELHELCVKAATELDFIGVYAIEFFIDKSDKIYINEISPRPHNSGHHTISANITSQYEQQIRVALDLPLGSTKEISPCLLVNLLAENASGPTYYQGLKEAYKIPNVQYTLYGKEEVRPFRKMGHALILEEDPDTALARMKKIRETLTITSYDY